MLNFLMNPSKEVTYRLSRHGPLRMLWPNLVTRFLLFSALMLISPGVMAQTDSCTIKWDSERQITNDTCFKAVPQVIAIGDTIHLLWYGVYPGLAGSSPDSILGFQYKHSFDGGKSYSKQIQLVALDSTAIGGGRLAASNGYLYLLYTARIAPASYRLGFGRSTDQGETWEPRRLLADADARAIAAHDSSVYILYEFRDSQFKIRFGCLASHDYGVTFDTVSKSILPLGSYYSPRSSNFIATSYDIHFVADGGTLIGNDGVPEVLHARSTDQGHTWMYPEILSAFDSISSVQPEIRGDDYGNVFVIWYDGKYGTIDGFHGSVIFRKSADHGATWEDEQLLSYTPTAIVPRISLNDQKLLVMWEEYRDWYHDRILMRMSGNVGESWCDTVEVDSLGGDVDCAVGRSSIFGTWFRAMPTRPGLSYSEIFVRSGKLPAPATTPLPAEARLYQNYPNPFNSTTRFQYDLPVEAEGAVSLNLYNILGQKITTLIDYKDQKAGHYELVWNPESVPTGVYFYRLRAGLFSITRKLLIIR